MESPYNGGYNTQKSHLNGPNKTSVLSANGLYLLSQWQKGSHRLLKHHMLVARVLVSLHNLKVWPYC